VGKASSNKKVARAARAGGKTKVRGQQGLVFPIALGAVVIIGLLLVVYARASRPDTVAEPPTVEDHWHAAYGIYVCGEWKPVIQNQNDAIEGTPIGIHTHADGVIHIHPFNSLATGSNATLGVFFETTGVEMTDESLVLPEGGGTFENGDDCAGSPGQVKVLVWDDADAAATSQPKVFITDFDNIRFTNDRMAMTIAFVNSDTDLDTLQPPSIPTLDNLSDLDPDENPTPGQTVPTTVAPGTTSAPTTAAPSTTTG
jgi:hypothetical protein